MSDDVCLQNARVLRDRIEPLVGQVYFSPECHAGYAASGFAESPVAIGGVAMPDGAAYFTSRGSLMGQVPGEVVAAAFAVFNPSAVAPAVSYGWSLTDAQVAVAVRALDDDIHTLFDLLERWGQAVIAAGGYPGVGGLLGSGR